MPHIRRMFLLLYATVNAVLCAAFFRSPREIRFRLWQQFENFRLLAIPPVLRPNAALAELPLPDPQAHVEALRGSKYAVEIERLAGEVLGHRFPLFNTQLDTGANIQWRKDYISGRSTGKRLFSVYPLSQF